MFANDACGMCELKSPISFYRRQLEFLKYLCEHILTWMDFILNTVRRV
jgi:hypothetical protein